jgi:dTMP kinase
MLIVLEGGDGAGTTTLQTGLTKALTERGYHVTTTHQPNRETQVGGLIREILASGGLLPPPAMALLFAADRVELTPSLSPESLDQIVICDRHLWSSLVYQADLGLDWLLEINKFAVTPDLVVYLRTPTPVALSRMDGRVLDGYERDVVLQSSLTERFDRVFNASRLPKVMIDGNGTPEQVMYRALEAIEAYLEDPE